MKRSRQNKMEDKNKLKLNKTNSRITNTVQCHDRNKLPKVSLDNLQFKTEKFKL